MAKLTITYENKEVKKELLFRNELFDYTMIPTEYGSTSNKQDLATQVENKFEDIDEDALGLIDQIDNEFFDLEDLLMELEEYESE